MAGTRANRNLSMLNDEYWSGFSADFTDYEVLSPIGFGAFSTVYAGAFRPSTAASSTGAIKGSTESAAKPTLPVQIPLTPTPGERQCALKISSSYPDVLQLSKEARLLALCRHPNVLRILAAFTLPPDHHRIAIVTPLAAGGSLAGILEWRSRLATSPKARHLSFFSPKAQFEQEGQTAGKFNEEEIKAVMRQVLEGLTYLHAKGFLHRDLKAGNLLIELDGTVLLADFGVGGDMNEPLPPAERGRTTAENIRFDRKQSPTSTHPASVPFRPKAKEDDSGKRRSFVGTPSWMAPEVILGNKYDTRADIWSLGITILELANGFAPRSNESPNHILKQAITDAPPVLRKSRQFSKNMKDFVACCLVKEPSKRATAAALLEHAWLKGAKNKSFLADTLLSNLPSLEARQEIRRVPSTASLASLASSWDFSVPNSPRSSLRPPVRSPSTFSQFDYFPSVPSRSHSRSSSRLPSLPPSPRVPLRQWAERTASESTVGESLQRRTASETGKRRSAVLRRGQSVSFDRSQIPNGSVAIPQTGARARRLPSMDTGLSMSPVVEAPLGALQNQAPLPVGFSQSNLSIGLEGLDIMHNAPLSVSPEEIGSKMVAADAESHSSAMSAPAMSATSSGSGHSLEPSSKGPTGRISGDLVSGLAKEAGTYTKPEESTRGWLGRHLSIKKEGNLSADRKSEGKWRGGKLKIMKNHET